MDIQAFFGSAFDCPCGKRHQILPRRVVVTDDAVAQMPALCGQVTAGRRAAVLMDVRTAEVAGRTVAAAMGQAGWQVDEIVIPDTPKGSPVCDDATHDALDRRLGPVDLIVPVGSGVLCDLGKWSAFQRPIPFVPFATAASMNGYSSANIAITRGGVKALGEAAAPPAVASCPAILAAAPYEMTASGLGDVLAKSVSSADWYMAHLLFGDFYCQAAVDLIADIEPLYLEHSADLAARRPAAIRTLLDALLLTGSAMTMVGTSTPASGGEHYVSHTLDMMTAIDGHPHDLHGRQVGIGTILGSALYRRVLAAESPDFRPPQETIDKKFWGRLTEPLTALYVQKLPRLRQLKQKLSAGGAWDDLRRSLSPMLRPPEVISKCLQAGGAAYRAEHIGCDRRRLLDAFLHAHQIRDRVTVLDLAWMLGLMPQAAADIVDRWA